MSTKRFALEPTPLEGLIQLVKLPIGDERGSFTRLFCANELTQFGWDKAVAQMNYTLTKKAGTIRGLHFQHPPHAEMKLVSCISGAVFDVVVDLRADSPTFLQSYGITLSSENHRSLLIPEGFAHGFQSLTDDACMLYVHSEYYHAASEDGLYALDERLTIKWPLKVTEMSKRDAGFNRINQDFEGVLTK